MMKGFSLVEALVSALILAVIIAGIYGALTVGDRAYNDDAGLLDLQQVGRLAMDSMVRELREVEVTSLAGDSIVFNLAGLAGSYYRDTSDINNDGITSQAIREYPVGTYKILAGDINSLSFCWQHPDDSCTISRSCGGSCPESYLLKIDLGLSKTVRQRPLSFALSEKVKLRNE